MSIGIYIAKMILKGVKIKKETILKIVTEADTDGDGYIDGEEVIYFMFGRKSVIKEKVL